jgi:hypothetical protein
MVDRIPGVSENASVAEEIRVDVMGGSEYRGKD